MRFQEKSSQSRPIYSVALRDEKNLWFVSSVNNKEIK